MIRKVNVCMPCIHFFIETNMEKKIDSFVELLDIMDKLRVGCPWDKKQTFDSLRHLTIEETYELSDAIMDNNHKGACEEIGDLLMHMVFYAKIAEENGWFTFNDVCEGINQKLIRRHPHIFGTVEANTPEQVKENWEKIKLQEGKRSVLGGVPKSLPALVKAYRIQDKARGVGFDWENTAQVWNKVEEEMQELKDELQANSSQDRIEEEFGDLLFALINYARFINVNPDTALERTNRKFINRFQYIEAKAEEQGKTPADMSLSEMEQLWEEAKKAL